MKKRIHRFLFYTLLVAVYGVFFSVESFYNFEGHSNTREIISRSRASQDVVKTFHLPYSSSHGVRLNKRYHQTNFPPCTVDVVTLPVRYIIPRTLGHDPCLRLPDVTILRPQLRGPPFAV